MGSYVHHIIEPKGGAFIMAFVLMLVFAFMTMAAGGVMFYMRNTTASVSDGFLHIRTLFYGRSIPLDEINIDGIRQLDLNTDTAYNISVRTNGISLPNYQIGWMRLQNGNRALVYLTDKSSVVLIPTRDFDILISLDDFDSFKFAFTTPYSRQRL